MNSASRAFLGCFLAVLMSCGPLCASSGPIIKQRAESEIELDLGMIVDDFAPSLIEMAALEDESAPEVLRALMGALGVEALDRMVIRTSLDDERGLTKITITLDPSADAGFLGDLFAVKPARFRFGRYLAPDDVALVAFSAGLNERIHAIENLLATPQMRQIAPMVPADPLSITAMWGIDAKKDILPLLTGEMDVIVLPCPEGGECEAPGMALVLGVTDQAAFREMLLGTLTKIMGPEKGDELRAVKGSTAGEFTFYPIADGVSYAVGPEFALVTTDPERLTGIVSGQGQGMSAIEATSYLRINGGLLVDWLASAIAASGNEDPQVALVANLLNALGGDVGTIEVTGRTGEGKADIEIRVPSTFYAAYYRFLKEFAAALPEMARAQAQAATGDADELQGVVSLLDDAFTRYGRDHDGTFPESPEGLVEAGYLDALPALQATPLGVWIDRGYTYLPLRDETGRVTGYYFFVYGGSEGAGYDVFTPDNVIDPSSFRVAADGEGDGVVGFSYDGSAIAQVEAWSQGD